MNRINAQANEGFSSESHYILIYKVQLSNKNQYITGTSLHLAKERKGEKLKYN